MGMSKTIYDVRRSKILLAELEKNGELKSTHAYPVQVLQFGKDLTLVALAGETVVDYSLRLKKEITGNPLWFWPPPFWNTCPKVNGAILVENWL